MIGFIIFLLIYVVLNLGVIACMDTLSLWKNHDELDLRMPRLANLDCKNIQKLGDDYVNNVIIPAHDYFNLKKSVLKKNDDTSSGAPFIFFFLICALWFRLSIFIAHFDDNRLLSLAALFGAIIFTGVISLINKKIYSKKFKMSGFWADKEWFKKTFRPSGYELDQIYDINNYMIREHAEFIKSSRGKVQLRRALYFIITTISVLLMLTYSYELKNLYWGN